MFSLKIKHYSNLFHEEANESGALCLPRCEKLHAKYTKLGQGNLN